MEGQIGIRLFCFVCFVAVVLFVSFVGLGFFTLTRTLQTTLLLENTQHLLQLSYHYQLSYLVCRKRKAPSYHQWQKTLCISNSYFSVAPDKTHGK